MRRVKIAAIVLVLFFAIPVLSVLAAMVTTPDDAEMYLGMIGTLVWIIVVGWSFVQVYSLVRKLYTEKVQHE